MSLFFVLLIFGLPVTLLYSWFHGKSGTSKMQKTELIFHVVNLVIAISVITYFIIKPSEAPAKEADSSISNSLIESRIAVLPFKNNTNDTELDVLGDMAADWIIEGLMNFEELKVVSFQNVKNHIEYASLGNWKSFSKQTGAEKIIKGSFYQQGDQLIFQSQVIDAVSGDFEFALPEIKGSKSNVEKIVSDLKQRIMTLVIAKTELDQYDVLDQRNPPTFDAYQNYVKANNHFGVDYPECEKFLNKAIALDSSFYQPYSLYVYSYTNVGNYEKADSMFRLIDLRIDKLTPYQNLNYDYLKEVVYGNSKTRYTAVKKLYEKDPKDNIANYVMGLTSLANNKPNEAIKVLEQIDLNTYRFRRPASVWRHTLHAYALIRMNKLVEAQEVLNFVPNEHADLGIYLRKPYIYILLGQPDSIHHMITKNGRGQFTLGSDYQGS